VDGVGRRAGAMSFTHLIRVRYGECDMQKVVFNAHYMAYCDDAVDTWFRAILAPDGSGFEALGFDFMLKASALTWHAPLVFGDTAELTCVISRWGNASFDVTIEGAAGGTPRFTNVITYVSVVPGENRPTRIPEIVRERLS
jgi:acyl-CoA thioester hydrolase